MPPALAFTSIFILALVASVLTRLWLASRQIRAVAQHRGAVPAAFRNQIPLTKHQRAADYSVVRLRLGLLDAVLGAMVLVAWTLLGGLDALNGLLMDWIGARPLLQPLALMVLFVLINAVLDLPLSLYQTFVVEQRFGFNRITASLWLSDLFKSTLVALIIGLPLGALLLWLMQLTGALWWFWTWVVWVAFSLLMLVLYPTVIAPLFNKFEPLEDPSVRERVTALMARCGFAAKGLFVMDGSRRSAHGNAYFTGLGAAKRVVFFDTLLKQLQPAEVEAVLAHELGHFKRKHVIKRMLAIFAISLAGLALLGWLAGQSWFYSGLGVAPNLPLRMGGSVPNHALALLLFFLVVPLFTFFAAPLGAALSRKHEFEADAYAAQHASGADLCQALVKLHKDNASTLTPDPLYVRFYYSHPPATQRIAHIRAHMPA